MAASTGIYTSDDYNLPQISAPNSSYIRRKFKAKVSTMLAQTGAAKFLLGDVILLAPIPAQCTFVDYRVYLPILDSAAATTMDFGDTQVLAGAVTGITSGSVAIPTVGTTFTLTAAASTASFTATNGLLMVGNGIIVNYESLSGSTFVNCRTFLGTGVIPNGAAIQQMGNFAAYQAASAMGNNATMVLDQDRTLTGTTIATLTVVQNATPVVMPKAFLTSALSDSRPTLGNISPFYFTMRLHAAINTAVTTGTITGWVGYYEQGY